MLESLREVIERLEAELKRQEQEIKGLRAERDEYRAVIHEHLKKQVDPKVWDEFNPADYTLTLDDIRTELKEKSPGNQ